MDVVAWGRGFLEHIPGDDIDTRAVDPRLSIARWAIRSTGGFSKTDPVSSGNCAASAQA